MFRVFDHSGYGGNMKKYLFKIICATFLLLVLSVILLFQHKNLRQKEDAISQVSNGEAYLCNFYKDNQEISLNSIAETTIKNYNKAAIYEVTSSNTDIISATLSDKKIIIKGKKYGEATITLKQIYGGKRTILGKSTVIVKKSSSDCTYIYMGTLLIILFIFL
jgi:hypothetical protein